MATKGAGIIARMMNEDDYSDQATRHQRRVFAENYNILPRNLQAMDVNTVLAYNCLCYLCSSSNDILGRWRYFCTTNYLL